MIGSTTVGYFDHYPNPFTNHAPGAEYHLNVMDNVMARDYLHKSSYFTMVLIVFLTAWLSFFFVTYLTSAAAAATAAVTLIAMLVASSQLMAHGTLVYPVAPGITLILSFLVLTVHRVLTEGAEKAMIKAKFGQFVSPEIV